MAFRQDFVFLTWLPRCMNRRYDIRYLKDAMGPTNDPAECSSIVRKDLWEKDPVAYALMNALELAEKQTESLEYVINKEDNPLVGARRRVSAIAEIVHPWIEAPRKARYPESGRFIGERSSVPRTSWESVLTDFGGYSFRAIR